MRNDKGKRMELGRAAGSGPFRRFLKHRGKNVAIFGGLGGWEGVGGVRGPLLFFASPKHSSGSVQGRAHECVRAADTSRRVPSPFGDTRAAKISQGRGFRQEKGTTNRLFRNPQK